MESKRIELFKQYHWKKLGLAQQKARFICKNNLDRWRSCVYIPRLEIVMNVMDNSIKKGWKKGWKK